MMKNDNGSMSIIGHLGELRKRIIVVLLFLIVFFVISYKFTDQLFNILLKPSDGLEFIYTKPEELLMTYLKVDLMFAILFTSPVFLINLWKFVKPALKAEERVYVRRLIFMILVFFIIGITFAYFVFLPLSIKFLLSFSNRMVRDMISIGNYISFVIGLVLSFGGLFELPIVVLFLHKIRIVNVDKLKKLRKFVIIIILVVAAVLTPPDVVSQLILSAPVFLLYEFSILLCSLMEKRNGIKK